MRHTLRHAALLLLLASVAISVLLPFVVTMHHVEPGLPSRKEPSFSHSSIIEKESLSKWPTGKAPNQPKPSKHHTQGVDMASRSHARTSEISTVDIKKTVPVSSVAPSNHSSFRFPASTNFTCLSEECIHGVAQGMARAYPFKKNHTEWIITSESGYTVGPNHTVAGIIYVKNFKAASSTAAGIALRVAHHRAHNSKDDHAWVKFAHVKGHKYAGRDRQRSLLFSSLRDPAARAVSRIFYTAITQKGQKPTDQNLLEKLRWTQRQYGSVSHEGGGYQVRYLSPHKDLPTSWDVDQPSIVQDPQTVKDAVREIIETYDFLMVAERMDESVVAFMLLTGLELEDVLVMDAKQNKAGHQYLYFSVHDPKTKSKREACKRSIPAVRSPLVEEHLASSEWRAKNYGDYLLHATAVASLDKTIQDRLGGPQVFGEVLEAYRALKQEAVALCANETVYHCSVEGLIQRQASARNCYFDDSGCGYPCIDRMLKERTNP